MSHRLPPMTMGSDWNCRRQRLGLIPTTWCLTMSDLMSVHETQACCSTSILARGQLPRRANDSA